MASWAAAMPSSNVPPWLISVATSSVGLISLPAISEKCVARLSNADFASSSALSTLPTVTMA